MKRFLIFAALLGLLPIALLADELQADSRSIPSKTWMVDVRDLPADLPNLPLRQGVRRAAADGSAWSYRERITNLPQFLQDFCDKYISAMQTVLAGGESWLSNPQLAKMDSRGYYIELDQLQDTIPFTFTPNAGNSEIQLAAEAAANPYIMEANAVFSGYASRFMPYVTRALSYDFPEAWWIGHSFNYTIDITEGWRFYRSLGEGNVDYHVTFKFYLYNQSANYDIRLDNRFGDNLRIPANIRIYSDRMETSVKDILENCKADTRYETLLKIHDHLTTANLYNYYFAQGNPEAALGGMPWSAYSGLVAGSDFVAPVCEGYARAMKVLCDRLEIPCVLVSGDCRSTVDALPSSHMWTYVQMEDDQWYALDPTWDDPYVPTSYRKRESGYENHDWFLIGAAHEVSPGLTLIESHPETSFFPELGVDVLPAPVLSEDDYHPTPVYATGDVDGDGIIGEEDIRLLSDILLQQAEDPTGMSDVNGDGRLTIADIVALIALSQAQ